MANKKSILKDSVHDFMTIETISFTQEVNLFLYRLKRVPVIKKKIPDSVYSHIDVKSIFAVFAMLKHIFVDFIKKSGYLILFDYFAVWLLQKMNSDLRISHGVFAAIFLINIVAGSIFNTITFEVTENNYIMLKIFKAKPSEYYLGKIVFKIITGSIYYLPGMMFIMYKVSDNMMKNSLYMILLIALSRIIGEAANIVVYDRFGEKGEKRFANCMILFVLMAYFGIFFLNGIPVCLAFLNHIGFALIFAVLAVLCTYYLFQYKGFHCIAAEYLVMDKTVYSFEQSKKMNDMKNADIKLDNAKIHTSMELSGKYEKLKGYQYMNRIFFDRHKKLLRTKFKWKMIIIAVITAAVVLAISITGKKAGIADKTVRIMPVMVFIMYVIASGNDICRAFYFNCDNSLLKYGYYRKASTILLNFMIRFKYLLKIDVILALAICVGSILTIIADGEPRKIINVIPVYVTIVLLAIFFDLYQLLLYYVIQPYVDGTDKPSFTFMVCTNAMYIVCYISMQIETTSKWFTIGILIFTIVAIPLSFLAIHKIAPKNFKLKRE